MTRASHAGSGGRAVIGADPACACPCPMVAVKAAPMLEGCKAANCKARRIDKAAHIIKPGMQEVGV